MQIKEVCERCRLTKKAIEYYEARGLVQPALLANGYRDYGEKEIAALQEISVLRRCGVGIPEIKQILDSGNKRAALERYRYVADLRLQRLLAVQQCMDGLLLAYDIPRAFDALDHCEDVCTIQERLVFAFPGNYGLFLSLHFGRFLNEAIDTEEKQAAYAAILQYLDGVDLVLPPELSALLEEAMSPAIEGGTAAFQAHMQDGVREALSDPDAYLEAHQEEIESYLAFKASDAFRQSPTGQLQQCLLAFQKASGYQEIFLANMKILSRSYTEYLGQLEAANETMLRRFPAARELYE